jgi:chemotaxis protein CheX
MEQWRGSARDVLTGGDPVGGSDGVSGVTHIQPFVDETIRTFDLMLDVAVRKVGEEKKEGAESVHELSGTVGISGSATGGVVLSLPEDAACKIVSRLLCEEVDEVNPDVEDVVAELVNIISARAKRALARQGLPDLRCALPNVVVGEGRRVWLARELPCVSIGFVAEEFGPFCLEISIRPVRESPARRGGRALQATVAEEAGEYGPETATPGADTGEGQAAMKILLVDDSVMLRKFAAAILADIDDMPVELIEAATGPEALAAVEEHGSSIDLILCDVGIPEIDGLSVLEKVKKTTDARDACVVIITGDVSDETVSRALKAGAAGFLVKPFSQDELTRLVREVHSRSARGLSTAAGDGLPLFRSASETLGEPPADDGPSQDEGS